MDVKAPLERYAVVTRSKIRTEDIERSVGLIRNSGIGYMFRTTVVPGLVGEEDILKISKWLSGSKVFQIQQFSPLHTLDPDFANLKPFGPTEIQKMADIARPYFSEVRVEGV